MISDNYRVCLVHFPNGDTTGAIREDSDGFYTIYIDDQLSPMGRLSAFLHEIKHMYSDDLNSTSSIRSIESDH